MNVSCFQDINIVLNAPVFSDIDGSGLRKKAYTLKFYNIAFVF